MPVYANVRSLAFSPDGRSIVAGYGRYAGPDRGYVKVWDAATGRQLFRIPGPIWGVNDLAISPDGKRLALAGSEVVELWDLHSRTKQSELRGHTRWVFCLEISPDGKRLASAGYDRTIKLWDMSTGREVITLYGHVAGLRALAFSLDGHRIISGGVDATARVWDGTPLPADQLRRDDERYRQKVETLAQLDGTIALASGVEKDPGNLQLRFQLVDALLGAGDSSRIAPACDDTRNRFGNGADSLQATAATGLCLLAQQAITDPAKRQAVHDLGQMPDDVTRVWMLGKYGLWDLVASGLTKYVEAKFSGDNPAGFEFFQKQLLSLVESGDLPGYQSAARKLLSQFSKTSDPNSLNNVAWVCVYAPLAAADLAVPVQMAEKAIAVYPPQQKRAALNTPGAALYRAGRIDEAIARLDESVKASGGVGVPQDWAFLAMAHFKKGNADEAHRWLEKLRSYKPDEKAGFSTDLIECRILLREADALLRHPHPARP